MVLLWQLYLRLFEPKTRIYKCKELSRGRYLWRSLLLGQQVK